MDFLTNTDLQPGQGCRVTAAALDLALVVLGRPTRGSSTRSPRSTSCAARIESDDVLRALRPQAD
ncbi:hypothetical protein ALI144C_51010 [Actinosynnema sp. ALI-1.44]|nr:hypothetical protein ALI144C_51010 [Actinosynnema sp. ALI-1.44]